MCPVWTLTLNIPLNWYFSMKRKLRKIWVIFDIENWLWKSEIGISLDLERMLIWQKKNPWKSAIFLSNKLPFDAKVDEKFLNVIYLSYFSWICWAWDICCLSSISICFWRSCDNLNCSLRCSIDTSSCWTLAAPRVLWCWPGGKKKFLNLILLYF